jgi:hypothetical protein
MIKYFPEKLMVAMATDFEGMETVQTHRKKTSIVSDTIMAIS